MNWPAIWGHISMEYLQFAHFVLPFLTISRVQIQHELTPTKNETHTKQSKWFREFYRTKNWRQFYASLGNNVIENAKKFHFILVDYSEFKKTMRAIFDLKKCPTRSSVVVMESSYPFTVVWKLCERSSKSVWPNNLRKLVWSSSTLTCPCLTSPVC